MVKINENSLIYLKMCFILWNFSKSTRAHKAKKMAKINKNSIIYLKICFIM